LRRSAPLKPCIERKVSYQSIIIFHQSALAINANK
jgi:hypothetical protein